MRVKFLPTDAKRKLVQEASGAYRENADGRDHFVRSNFSVHLATPTPPIKAKT